MATQDEILRLILERKQLSGDLSKTVQEWVAAMRRMDTAADQVEFDAASREAELLRQKVEALAVGAIKDFARIDKASKELAKELGVNASQVRKVENAVSSLAKKFNTDMDRMEAAAKKVQLRNIEKEAKETEKAIDRMAKEAASEISKVEKAAKRVEFKKAREEARQVQQAIKTLEQSASRSFRVMEQRAEAAGAELRTGIGGNLTRLNPKIQQLQRRFQSAVQAMRTASDRVTFDKAAREAQRLEAAINRMGKSAAKDLDRVKQSAQSAGQGVSTLSQVTVRLRQVLAGLGIALSARSLLQFGQDAIQTGIRVQALQAQLEAAGGTQERFTELQRFASESAERLGFDYEVLAQSTARFEAASRLAGIAEDDRLNVIRSVLEASRVLQLSNQRINNTLLALEQIASKGTVSMEELRRQLGDNLPGAVAILAKEMGLTIEQLIKQIELNKVLSQDALPALARGFDKAFGPGLQVALKTTATSIGQLEKELLDLKVEFSEAFGDELRRSIRATTSALEDMGPAARVAGRAIGEEVSQGIPVLIALGRAASVFSETLESGGRGGDRFSVGIDAATQAGILFNQMLGSGILRLLGFEEQARTSADIADALGLSYESLLKETTLFAEGSATLEIKLAEVGAQQEVLERRSKRLKKEISELKGAIDDQGFSTTEQRLKLEELETALEDTARRTSDLAEEESNLTGERNRGVKTLKETIPLVKALREERRSEVEGLRSRISAEEQLNNALAEGFDIQRAAREEVFGSVKELESDTQELIDAVSSLRLNAEELKEVIDILGQSEPFSDEQIDRLREFGDVSVEQVQKIREEVQGLLDAFSEMGEVPPEALQLLAEQFEVTTSTVEEALDDQTKAAEKAAKEQQKHYEEIRKSIQSIGEELLKLSDQVEGVDTSEVDDLQEKLEELEDQKFDLGVGDLEEFNRIEAEIEKVRDQLALAVEAQEEVGQAGSDMAEQIDDALRSIVEKIGPAFGELSTSGQGAIESILQRLQNLGQLGDVTSQDIARAVQGIITEFQAAGLPVADLRSAFEELQTGAFDLDGALAQLRKELEEEGKSLGNIKDKTDEIKRSNEELFKEVARGKALYKEFADTADSELGRAAGAYDALLTRQRESLQLCEAFKRCMAG